MRRTPHRQSKALPMRNCSESPQLFSSLPERRPEFQPLTFGRLTCVPQMPFPQVFRSILDASPEKEHFYVLPVDAKSHPLCAPLDISQGSVSKTPVHPREVFCEAVRYRAYAIIVAHNHPTGDPEPSKEDIAITERLIETGKLLGIHVLDHLVLGSPSATNEAGYVSIRHLGVLEF